MGDSFLHVLEEADYSPTKVRSQVKKQIADRKRRIREMERMTDAQFRKYISRSMFGVYMKEFYIGRWQSQISELGSIPERMKNWMEWRKEDKPSLFDLKLKMSFKGNIRRAKKTFELLSQRKRTRKKKTGLEKWI